MHTPPLAWLKTTIVTHWFSPTNQIACNGWHLSDSEETSSLSSYIAAVHPATSFSNTACMTVTCVKWTPSPASGASALGRAQHLPALSCSCHAWPHVANKQTCPYHWKTINGGRSHLDPGCAGENSKANVMGFSVSLLHTEILNYTKGLMLLLVPWSLPLCFMMTTEKTRSLLKLSCSLPPLLQFYLSFISIQTADTGL